MSDETNNLGQIIREEPVIQPPSAKPAAAAAQEPALGQPATFPPEDSDLANTLAEVGILPEEEYLLSQEHALTEEELWELEHPPKKPQVVLVPSQDNLQLEVTLVQQSENTIPIEAEDIWDALSEAGVVFGVDEEVVEALSANPIYDLPFVVAKGVPPQTGADGYLEYLFNTEKTVRPKELEDGTVDFHELGLFENVFKGQPLCNVHPPEKGQDGYNIYGARIDGHFGRRVVPYCGRNVELTEDRLQVLATCNGNVEMVGRDITVVDVLNISENVDNATGDIIFVGDVAIQGDVISGFRVETEGNIFVKGSVEGATLIAGGDVVINVGINGMDKGYIKAKGSVRCKYIQRCKLDVDTDIYADSIMYCDINCGGNVELTGKRGVLIGGKSNIAGKLSTRAIGATTHVATEVNMCATIKEIKGKAEVLRQMAELDTEITKLQQILERYDEIARKKRVALTEEQQKTILVVKQHLQYSKQRRKLAVMKLEHLQREQLRLSEQNSFIECKSHVHTGVALTFGPLVMTITNSLFNVRIYVKDGEIDTAPLGH